MRADGVDVVAVQLGPVGHARILGTASGPRGGPDAGHRAAVHLVARGTGPATPPLGLERRSRSSGSRAPTVVTVSRHRCPRRVVQPCASRQATGRGPRRAPARRRGRSGCGCAASRPPRRTGRTPASRAAPAPTPAPTDAVVRRSTSAPPRRRTARRATPPRPAGQHEVDVPARRAAAHVVGDGARCLDDLDRHRPVDGHTRPAPRPRPAAGRPPAPAPPGRRRGRPTAAAGRRAVPG